MSSQNNSFVNYFQISKGLSHKSNKKKQNRKDPRNIISKYLSPNNSSNFIVFTDNSKIKKKNNGIFDSSSKRNTKFLCGNKYQLQLNPFNSEKRNFLYIEKQAKNDKEAISDLYTEIKQLKEKIKILTDENIILLNDKKNLNIKVMNLQKDKQLLIERLTDLDKLLNNKIKIKLNQNEDNLTGLQNQIYELKNVNDNLKIQNNIQQNIINELKKQIIQNHININDNKIYEKEKLLNNPNKSLILNPNIIHENSSNNLNFHNKDIINPIKKGSITNMNVKMVDNNLNNYTQSFVKTDMIIEDDKLSNPINLKKKNLFLNIKNPRIKKNKKDKYLNLLKCNSYVNINNKIDNKKYFIENFNYENCSEIDNNTRKKSLNNLNIIKKDKKKNEKINYNNYTNNQRINKYKKFINNSINLNYNRENLVAKTNISFDQNNLSDYYSD